MRAVTMLETFPTRSLLSILTFIVLITAATSPTHAQVLHGQVVDSVNAEPIAGLEVVLLDVQEDTVAVTRSGHDGRFAVNVPKGKYKICLRCIGHRPKQVEVEVPSETPVVIRLAQIGIPPSS